MSIRCERGVFHFIKWTVGTGTSGTEYDLFSGSTIPEVFSHAILRHYTVNVLGQVAAGAAAGEASAAITVLPEYKGPVAKRTLAYVGTYTDTDAAVVKTTSVTVSGSPNVVLKTGERLGYVYTENGACNAAGYGTVTLEVFPADYSTAPPSSGLSLLEILFGGKR